MLIEQRDDPSIGLFPQLSNKFLFYGDGKMMLIYFSAPSSNTAIVHST